MSLYERRHSSLPYLENMRMGVIIENESNEEKSVWFLGNKRNNYKHMDGITLQNMFSDTFLDDNSLTMLRNWLISKGEIIIALTRFTADNEISYSFGDKLIINDGKDINNTPVVRYITQYFNPYQFQCNVIDMAEQILVDAFISFNVTVKSGSKVGVLFFPSNNISNSKKFDSQDFNEMNNKMKEDNKEFDNKSKKRYLLLLR